MTPGSVVLVGAGPGDPELLTLAAVKAIAAADVLLVDDLVDRRVLAHASTSARIVDVGKRGRSCRTAGSTSAGSTSTPQAFIERLMIAEARRGARVVRLKGGDPYVFGRGGEERAHLVAAGIDVRVVPGITSGIAAPAAIGVPVTHRDHAQGVIFVTGHRMRDDGDDVHAPDVDWRALAATGLTLVVYMGVARVREIGDALVAGGKPKDTPAAAIQAAATEAQRHVVATLATLADAMERARLGSPAILVVGDVVRFADAAEASIALRTGTSREVR